MRFILATVMIVMLAADVMPAWGGIPVLLKDQNSTFLVDPLDNRGATLWTLDDVNQLYTQQWYYRLTDEVNTIDCFGNPVVVRSQDEKSVSITYTPAGLNVYLGYELQGGPTGSNVSRVRESFRLENLGTEDLVFTLFEYSDFDLYPFFSNDKAERVSPTAVTQWDPTGLRVNESVERTPSHWYIGPGNYKITGDLPDSQAIWGEPNGADCAWAFQWDLVVPVGGSIEFTKCKYFGPDTQIPEPMSVVLGIMGLAAVGGLRRLRR